ncbi:MAG: type II and III secretion system protein [Thermodesulfobacteriota bacterium]|nr:type II and III secretion system protein [Thermodesulfobacteriota bacterium]
MKDTGKFICSAFVLALLLSLLAACAPTNSHTEQEVRDFLDQNTAGSRDVLAEHDMEQQAAEKSEELPQRFQNPMFLLDDVDQLDMASEFSIPVGADISSVEPVSLRDIMKKLAKFHNMNISWGSDVNQKFLVDVHIRAEEDFFAAIDNILRQVDYHYEVEGQTLVIKNKETRKFYIAVPAMASIYSTATGGDVLGGTGGDDHQMTGTLDLKNSLSEDEALDVWKSIKGNLDKILQIWSGRTGEVATESAGGEETASTATYSTGEGFYFIDKSVGMITVTAPHSIMEQCAAYIDNLKTELFRQVTIEAKIIEVTLAADNRTGIDWAKLLEQSADLANGFVGNFDFQKLNPRYHDNGTTNRFFTLDSYSFEFFLDAMTQQGSVEVLSNPRINAMNGQPAMISIGTTIRFIESVSVDIDSDTGVRTYTAEPGTVMSGLGLGIVATIVEDKEVVLNLTPVTSSLEEDPIETVTFGDGGVIGLPRVRIREMNTNVRVKNGEMLIIGGLIDDRDAYDENKVVGLGDVAGKLFMQNGDVFRKSELVVILRPVIHSL